MDDRQDVGGKLVGLSHSGRPRSGLRDLNIRSIAKPDATALSRRQGGPGPVRDHLPFVLRYRTAGARRLRKYSVFMAVLLVLTGSFGALLTLHWHVEPPKK